MSTRSPGWRVRASSNGGWDVQMRTAFGWATYSHFPSWASAVYYANLLAN